MSHRGIEAKIKRTPLSYKRAVFQTFFKIFPELKVEYEENINNKLEILAAEIYHERVLDEYPESVFEIFNTIELEIKHLEALTSILDRKKLYELYGVNKSELLYEISALNKKIQEVKDKFYPILEEIYKKISKRKK